MHKIDHLGIAVKSLARAKTIYEKLGLHIMPEEIVPQEKVRVAMVPVGESRVELLEPTSEDSTIAKFIAKRGEGLHHICYEVENLEAKLVEMRAKGVRILDGYPRPGAEGKRVAFLHPASANGVLIELSEKLPE